MRHTKVFCRDFGESSQTAYLFNGKHDLDSIREYFSESLDKYFEDHIGNAGSAYQYCWVWNCGSRTLAYIDSGLDI